MSPTVDSCKRRRANNASISHMPCPPSMAFLCRDIDLMSNAHSHRRRPPATDG